MKEHSAHIDTIHGTAFYEETIKKSRFLAYATRVESTEDVTGFLKSMTKPDASHHCWAYKIGNQYRFNDDGEPGGTAGRPIYMAIDHQGLDHVLVLVIRYFGGIKLGSGGLARAYGGSAAKCLQRAVRFTIKHRILARIDVPFSKTGIIYNILENSPDIQKSEEAYLPSGIRFTVQMNEDVFSEFQRTILDATNGDVTVTRLAEPA